MGNVCISLVSGGFLAISGIPWLIDASLPSSSFAWHCFSMSKFHLFIRTPIYWIGIEIHPKELIFTSSSAKTLFPNEVKFTATRCFRTSIDLLGDTIQPRAGLLCTVSKTRSITPAIEFLVCFRPWATSVFYLVLKTIPVG